MDQENYIFINKYSSMPLHEQLKSSLEEAIRSGKLRPGDKLPTENEICDRFGISRPVVRQAYNALAADGMMERKRGKGSFVREFADRGMFLMRLASYQEEMDMMGMKAETHPIGAEQIAYEPEVYGRLQLREDRPCLRLIRMRYADSRPFGYIENYVPLELFPGIDVHDFSRESLYHVMKEEYRICPVKAERSIRAEIIREDLAPLLELEPGAPVNKVQSVAYDQYERPIDYSVEYYPGNTHHFDFTVYKE